MQSSFSCHQEKKSNNDNHSDYEGDDEGDNGDIRAKMFTQETISPCPPVTLRQEISPLVKP